MAAQLVTVQKNNLVHIIVTNHKHLVNLLSHRMVSIYIYVLVHVHVIHDFRL